MPLIRELDREGWSEYLDAVSRELLNTPASIEIVPDAGFPAVEAAHQALQTLTYDQRNDVFEVAVARGGPRLPSVLRHLVDHPIRIAVDSVSLLAPLTIAVDGHDGVRTVIRIERQAEFAG
jgi:hypothetical protein